jgi:hypothetical protein
LHNKARFVAAVRVSNPNRSPAGINSRDAAPTPPGSAEIIGDDFPVAFHADGFCRFCSPHGNEKVIECPTLMQSTIHAYKVQPRKDKRGVRMLRLPLHIPGPS